MAGQESDLPLLAPTYPPLHYRYAWSLYPNIASVSRGVKVPHADRHMHLSPPASHYLLYFSPLFQSKWDVQAHYDRDSSATYLTMATFQVYWVLMRPSTGSHVHLYCNHHVILTFMQPLQNNYISQDKPRRNSWWQIHMEPAHFISQRHFGCGYRKSDCLTGRKMKILSQATNPTPTKIYWLILNKNQTYKNLPNSSKLFSNQFQVLYKLTYSRVVGFWISIGN